MYNIGLHLYIHTPKCISLYLHTCIHTYLPTYIHTYIQRHAEAARPAADSGFVHDLRPVLSAPVSHMGASQRLCRCGIAEAYHFGSRQAQAQHGTQESRPCTLHSATGGQHSTEANSDFLRVTSTMVIALWPRKPIMDDRDLLSCTWSFTGSQSGLPAPQARL